MRITLLASAFLYSATGEDVEYDEETSMHVRFIETSWLGSEVLETIRFHEMNHHDELAIANNVSIYFMSTHFPGSFEIESGLLAAIKEVYTVVVADVIDKHALSLAIGRLKELLLARRQISQQVGSQNLAWRIYQIALKMALFQYDSPPEENKHLRAKLNAFELSLGSTAGGIDGVSPASPSFLALKAAVSRVAGLPKICQGSEGCAELLEEMEMIIEEYANVTQPERKNVPMEWLFKKNEFFWEDYPLIVLARKVTRFTSCSSPLNSVILRVKDSLASL